MINLKEFFKDNATNFGSLRNCERISTDTRGIQEGDLFWALAGENFDGFNYLKGAIEKGAIGCVFEYSEDRKEVIESMVIDFPEVFFVGVKNSEESFQGLAKYHHQEWIKGKNKKTIGITGSNGKTTTKELMAGVLDELFPGKTLFTLGNLNNHLGLPMTQLRLKNEHDICILEMGTNHPGEIKFLCELGGPDFGIITNVGQSHLEFFESEENVFIEKRILCDYVKSRGGVCVLDGDNIHLNKINSSSEIVKVGLSDQDIILKTNGVALDLSGKIEIAIEAPHIFGDHNFKNLSLVLTLLLTMFPELKNEIESACKVLKLPENHRSQFIEKDGKVFFLDAYNANPSSMLTSLKTFLKYLNEKGLSKEKALFVLGDMNELGDNSPRYHEEIGEFLGGSVNSNAVFVGRFSEHYKNGFKGSCELFQNSDELKVKWSDLVKEAESVFIKGSRTLQLESLMALN